MIESWNLEGKQGYWRSYIAEVPVQYLNIVMDDLKSFQFIVSRINAHAEVKASVSVLFTVTDHTIKNQCYDSHEKYSQALHILLVTSSQE